MSDSAVSTDPLAFLDNIRGVDIETGGLAPHLPITEIAYGTADGEVVTIIPPHDTSKVEKWALENTGYLERGLNNPDNWCTPEDIEKFREEIEGKYILGSNPSFDTLRLSNLLGGSHNDFFNLVSPWKYRLIDVASLGSYALGFDLPEGIHKVSQSLRALGYEVPLPDHTAAQDVRAAWACYLAVLDIRKKKG